MLVLRFCLLLVTFPFTHLLATDDFSSDLDTSLFSSLDDQDLESNGDLLEGYLTDSQGLPPGLHFQEFPPPLNSEDLVPSLYAQDLSLGGEFDEELSSCPEDIDSPSKKLRARNSQCPNIPSGPINLPDLTNLLNSININEVQTDEETQDLPSLSKALQTFCVNSASGPRMVILVCGSVTYPDGVGQRPGYFIVVRNSWLGQSSKF